MNSVNLQDIKLIHCCISIHYQTKDQENKLKKQSQDFPGGPVVKNPPAKPIALSTHTLELVLPNK